MWDLQNTDVACHCTDPTFGSCICKTLKSRTALSCEVYGFNGGKNKYIEDLVRKPPGKGPFCTHENEWVNGRWMGR
jgi:hypothetical protein